VSLPPPISASARLGEIDAAAALRQFVRREGPIGQPGSENGTLRMDWVDTVAELLADDRPLVELEWPASEWRRCGVRHVVWSAMGGSGVTVRILAGLGSSGPAPSLHVLNSTDPVALDALVAGLADAKDLPTSRDRTREHLRALFEDVVLVAGSLGLTSQEPATHLSWFLQVLTAACLLAKRHALVLMVPGSRLEEAAALEGVGVRPAYLAGRPGLPGRMSVPATFVFLLGRYRIFRVDGIGPDGTPHQVVRRYEPLPDHGRGEAAIALLREWALTELISPVPDDTMTRNCGRIIDYFSGTGDNPCLAQLALTSVRRLHAWAGLGFMEHATTPTTCSARTG
jgi:hypothetical protein